MAGSSATTIIRPDITVGAPGAGALYVQQQTIGVTVDQPSGVNLIWTQSDIAGNGPVSLRQNGTDIAYSTSSKVPLFAALLPTVDIGTPFLLGANTVLPAPDFSITGGSGRTSFARVQANTDIDWVGGIATPVPNAGQSPLGGLMYVTNCSPSGAQINVIDQSGGGAILCSHPSVEIGFHETGIFLFDAPFGWQLIGKAGIYRFNGGTGVDPGSRVITTSSNVATPLIKFTAGTVQTPGIAIRFDIGATKNDGLGTTQAWWIGGEAAWDGANTLQSSSKGTATGTNGGAPPAGWDIGFFSNVGGFNGVNAIGDNINTIKWRIKVYTIASPS